MLLYHQQPEASWPDAYYKVAKVDGFYLVPRPTRSAALLANYAGGLVVMKREKLPDGRTKIVSKNTDTGKISERTE